MLGDGLDTHIPIDVANKALKKNELILGGISLESANNMAASIGTFRNRIKI